LVAVMVVIAIKCLKDKREVLDARRRVAVVVIVVEIVNVEFYS
jgi:hypothetical protein